MESAAKQEKRVNNNAIHGNIYQLKVLMLFLYRGVSNRYSFRLGTEIEQAHKFDDLVFEYVERGKKVYRLLQAKHRLDETKKITVRQLCSEIKGDFSLTKYFFSYQRTKKELLFKDGSIRDVTICTNIDFDFEDLKRGGVMVEKIFDEDDILDVVSDKKQPSRYKISKTIRSLLKSKLLEVDTLTPDNYKLDDEILDFLDHLVFAVNQPNEDELGDIVMTEIGREFDYLKTEIVYNKFLIKMLNWLQGKGDGEFLSSEEGERFFEEARKGIPIWFGLRDPIESFVGRGGPLKKLHDMLQAEGTRAYKAIVIAGLGGVGKSELARKYAKTHSSLHDDNVVWVQAESYQSLVESFHRLACDVLGISTKNANGEEKEIRSVVEDVYKFFSKGKSLFIFDNGERFKTLKDYDQGLDKFLPALPTGCKKPHLLITTRNQKWPKSMKVLPLDTFCPEEAEEFITKYLNLKDITERDDVTELANELQFFPLALQQAVAYIKVQNEKLNNVGSCFKIKDYLKRYATRAKELLDFEFPEDSDNDYTKTMMRTWVVTFDEIARKDSGQYALKIVEILAYVSADDIPTELFSSLVDEAEKLGSAIEILKQHSIITNLKKNKFDVHRLLQKIVGLQIRDKNEEKNILTTAIKLFSNEAVNLANLEHAIMVWHHSSSYNDIVSEYCYVSCSISKVLMKALRWEEAHSFSLMVTELFSRNMLSVLKDRKLADPVDKLTNQRIPTFLIDMKIITARALIELGKYCLALKEYSTAHTLINQTFGPDHVLASSVKSYIGDVHRLLGEYDKASKYYEEAFSGLKSNLGYDHQRTLATKSGIAEILSKKGKFAESLKMHTEVHMIKEAKFGKHGCSTILTRIQIAELLNEMEKYEDALELLNELGDYQERTLGKNHPDTLKTKFSTAGVLSALDRGDPMSMYKAISAVQKSLYGENHPTFLNTLSNMGQEMYKKGKYNEAIKLFQEVLDKTVNILSPDHNNVLSLRSNIAFTLDDQGKPQEAMNILQEVLSAQKKVLGSKHPKTDQMRLIVAELMARLGKFDESFKQFKDVKLNSSTYISKKNLDFQFNVGTQFYNQGRLDEALEIFQHLLDKQLTCLKPDDQEILITKHRIGQALERKGRYTQASAIFEDELRNATATLGNDHDDTLIASLHLAYSKSMLGELGKARSLCQKAMEIITKIPGKCCTEIMLSPLNKVASVFHDRNNKYNEALEINQFILSHQRRTLDDNHPELLKTLSNIAGTSIELQLIDKALTILQEILPKFHKTFGLNQPETMGVTQMLAETYTKKAQFHKAFSLFKELLKYRKSTVGDYHYETIKTEYNLGLVNYEMRNYDQALELLRDVLKKSRTLQMHPADPIKMNTQFCIEMITKEKEKHSRIPKEDLKQKTAEAYRNSNNKNEYNILLAEIKHENKDKLEKLLKQGEDVDSSDRNSRTLLHHAVDIGNIDIVNLLLKHGADVTRVTDKGNTPLHIATIRGHKNIVETLLQHKRTDHCHDFINTKTNVGGTTSLHVASERGHFDIVVSLLRHGGAFDIRNNKGKTPLDLAKDDDVVGFLKLTTKMFEWAAKGDATLISRLEKAEIHLKIAIMNARDYAEKSLLQVALANNMKLATRLSKLQEDVGRQSQNGNKATQPIFEDLMAAVEGGNIDKLEKLLKQGGEVNSVDERNGTLLHHAVDIGNIDVLNLLLKHGADVTNVTDKGNTPLHIATVKGHKNIVEVLLQQVTGATLNYFINTKTTVGGTTSLHVAAERGHFDIVVSLLRHGGAFDIRNKNGKTPLDLAKNDDVVGFLQLVAEMFECAANGDMGMISKMETVTPHQKSALMNARNVNERTLNQTALSNNHKELALALSNHTKGESGCKEGDNLKTQPKKKKKRKNK